ncbi:MAG: PAS domain S-box protein, partial [Sphaerospermopsis kisseleviana]
LLLSQASAALAKGELHQPLLEKHIITEIQALATSFNVMSEQIEASFNRVDIALKESTEKYKTVFETLPVGILITDPEGKIIEGNRIVGQILDISPQEYNENLYHHNWEIIRSDGSPMPISEFASVRALKENSFIRDVEKDIIQPDGSIHWFSVSAAPIPLENYGVAIAYVDITERKNNEIKRQQVERTLLESEIRYRQVVQQQTDFILRSEPDTTITFCNEALCLGLGCKLEDLLGKKWIDIGNPDYLQSTLIKLSQLTPENPSFLGENLDKRSDGNMVWTQWINHGILNELGQLIEIQSVGRDVTDLKITELALRDSENRFQKIAASLPGGIYIIVKSLNDSKYFEYISAGFTKISEIKVEDLMANYQLWLDCIHPDDIADYTGAITTSLENLSPF